MLFSGWVATMRSRGMGLAIIVCTAKMGKCWRLKTNEMVKFVKTMELGAKRMCVVTISSRYQITIPKELRERFDIEPGDKALFIPRGKTIELVFARTSDELAELKRLHSKTSEFSENSEV